MAISTLHSTLAIRSLATLVGATAFLLSGSALASAASGDDAPPSARDGDLLGGPKVDDSAGKDDRAFGKDGKAGKGVKAGEQAQRRPLIKVRLWMETMKTMQLAPDQREKVDAIVARFQEARSAFEKEHGEARRALEQSIKANGPETAEGKEARQAMKALAEKAPRPEPYQTEAFAVLTPEQQASFKTRLADREAQLREAADGKGMAGKEEGRGKGAPKGPGDDKDGAPRKGRSDGPAKPGRDDRKKEGLGAPPMKDEPMR